METFQTKDRSIEAFNINKNKVQIFEAGSRANALELMQLEMKLEFSM